MSPSRKFRYQGAILRDHHLLLIEHRFHADGHCHWLIPGGGLEDGETEEACVRREMREETGLAVAVERLLLEESAFPADRVYAGYKTFLCRPVGGEARPGYEPEPEAAAAYAISAVGWFDLRAETAWGEAVCRDPITYPLLKKLQATLGYD